MHESLNLVISNEVRDLAFPATYEKRISRLRLEMTIATQSPTEEDRGEVPNFFGPSL